MFWFVINSIKLIIITYIVLFISDDLDWTRVRALMLCIAVFLLINQQVIKDVVKDERLILPSSTNIWDRRSIFLYQGLGPLGIFVFGALDHRFRITSITSINTSWFGEPLSMFFFVFLCSLWTYIHVINPFYVRTFRIQYERSFHIIQKGAYGIIRHPGYLIEALILLDLPLILNSWLAFIPAGCAVAVLLTRTQVEDLVLKRHYKGYYEYQKSVKYRLIPWIW